MKILSHQFILPTLLATFLIGCDDNSSSSPPPTPASTLTAGVTYWDTTAAMTTKTGSVPLTVVALMDDSNTLYFTVSRRDMPLYHSAADGDHYRIVAKAMPGKNNSIFIIDTALSLIDNKAKFYNGNIQIFTRTLGEPYRQFNLGFRDYQDTTRGSSTTFSTEQVKTNSNAQWEMGYY